MKFSARQYAQALSDSLNETENKDHEKILDNFVKVLAENNDLRLFEEISNEFHKLELAKKGIKQVEVVTAHPINKENEHEIIKELNKLVKIDFEIKKRVDESIIGGVVIKVDDQMLDASVKNNLEQLKKEIIN